MLPTYNIHIDQDNTGLFELQKYLDMGYKVICNMFRDYNEEHSYYDLKISLNKEIIYEERIPVEYTTPYPSDEYTLSKIKQHYRKLQLDKLL